MTIHQMSPLVTLLIAHANALSAAIDATDNPLDRAALGKEFDDTCARLTAFRVDVSAHVICPES